MLSPKESEVLKDPVTLLAINMCNLDHREVKYLLSEILNPAQKTKYDLASKAKAKYREKKLHGCETGDCTDCGDC